FTQGSCIILSRFVTNSLLNLESHHILIPKERYLLSSIFDCSVSPSISFFSILKGRCRLNHCLIPEGCPSLLNAEIGVNPFALGCSWNITPLLASVQKCPNSVVTSSVC